MTTYYNKGELRRSIKLLVDNYLKECSHCQNLSQDFIDLIKHNFLAKFVCYNKETDSIEIGIENQLSEDSYPEIKVFSYPVKSRKWIDDSFKDGKNDLDFYGKLLNRQRLTGKDAEVVVM